MQKQFLEIYKLLKEKKGDSVLWEDIGDISFYLDGDYCSIKNEVVSIILTTLDIGPSYLRLGFETRKDSDLNHIDELKPLIRILLKDAKKALQEYTPEK